VSQAGGRICVENDKLHLPHQMWSHLCFPEWKQKPQKRKLEEGDEPEEVEQPEEKQSKTEADEEEEEEKQSVSREEGEGPSSEVADDGSDVNDRLCHLCMFVRGMSNVWGKANVNVLTRKTGRNPSTREGTLLSDT
jgi:hypothetical protein